MTLALGTYKPFFFFLLRFFASYGLLYIAYQSYLNQYAPLQVDRITYNVSWQVQQLLQLFGADVAIPVNTNEASVRLVYSGKYVARVVEGCNAVSILILFVSFIMAFYSGFKRTLLYILVGIGVIYFLNIVRIALLAVLLYYYPEHEHVLHDVLFPLFIYGVVFVLWILWLHKFGRLFEKTPKV